MKKILNKYAGQIKQFIKDLTYRMDGSTQDIVLWSEGLPSILGSIVRWVVYKAHDFVRLLRDFPRAKVIKLTGDEWSIIFVGGDDEYRVIKDLIFRDQEVQVELLSKVLVWRLPVETSSWLESGIDLVICELSRLFPWKPVAMYSFSGPDSVRQVVDLPDTLDDMLVGQRNADNRRLIRKAEKQGLSYRFTRSLEDLEFFHKEMYLPFISNRHGKTANLSSLEDHQRWLKYSWLLLVSMNDRPIGGAINTRPRTVSHGIEIGILQNDIDLIKDGAVSMVIWCGLQWAKEQGATQFDLGGSQPWCSDRIFQYKSKWGAHVERAILCSRPNRIFLSNQLPVSLRERINQIGMISEIGEKHYCVYIPAMSEELGDDQIQEAQRRGLEGVAMIQPGSIELVTAQHLS